MLNNISFVEEQAIKILKDNWIEQKELNSGLSLAAFVYRYNEYIYTHYILKALYSNESLKGSFKLWL